MTIHIDAESGDLLLNGSSVKPADYVFAPDYELTPLAEVKDFILANSHLPGVPSGNAMKAEGLGLAALSMTLLEKVEELTLHLIRQQEEINMLKNK